MHLTFLHFTNIFSMSNAEMSNAWINISAFDIENIFVRWKNSVLQMLETWLSKERLLSNSTPRFLTDDEESREQPSSIRPCSRLLIVWFLGPIINTSVFSEFSSKKLFVIQFFISTMHSISFSIWSVSLGPWRNIELSIISITVKANPMFPDDISQG